MDIKIDRVRESLENCSFDSEAESDYDIMAGGLFWSDEVPDRNECREYLSVMLYLRRIIAYRASLTLNEERVEFRDKWLELKDAIPNWPGFKNDRIYGSAVRLLKIHKYKEEKIIKDLEENG